MKLILGMMILVTVACSDRREWSEQKYDPVCVTKEEKRELADFIIKCAEAANPKSDEEGEDLVSQCELTGARTLCPVEKVCRTNVDPGGFASLPNYGSWTKCP